MKDNDYTNITLAIQFFKKREKQTIAAAASA